MQDFINCHHAHPTDMPRSIAEEDVKAEARSMTEDALRRNLELVESTEV
jgi:hypothetical protein